MSALLDAFERLAIPVKIVEHPAVYTVEQSKALRGELPGAHLKNLLLRNKKNQLWLLCALEDTPIDIKALGEKIGSGRLSFANAEQLMATLGVEPGAVTPFGIINDENGLVTVVLEERVLGCELLNFHPLRNDATATIAREDFLRFLESQGHKPVIASLS